MRELLLQSFDLVLGSSFVSLITSRSLSNHEYAGFLVGVNTGRLRSPVKTDLPVA
jgi:hypothetical protein